MTAWPNESGTPGFLRHNSTRSLKALFPSTYVLLLGSRARTLLSDQMRTQFPIMHLQTGFEPTHTVEFCTNSSVLLFQ